MCLPSDALLQHLPSYLSFSYLGRGVSLHGSSRKTQPLLLTLDEGYLLPAAVADLQCGIAPLGPCAATAPQDAPPGRRPWPGTVVVTKIIHKVAVLFMPISGCLGNQNPRESASRVVIRMSCSRKPPEGFYLPTSSPLTLP